MLFWFIICEYFCSPAGENFSKNVAQKKYSVQSEAI